MIRITIELVKDYVKIKEYYPCIEIDMVDDEGKNQHLNNTFIFTKDIISLTKKIINPIVDSKRSKLKGYEAYKSHLIIAEYGKGKSRFLVTLINLLKYTNEPINQILLEQISEFDSDLLSSINELSDDKILLSYENASQSPNVVLSELLYKSIKQAFISNSIEFSPKSRITNMIDDLLRLKETRPELKDKFEKIRKDTLKNSLSKLEKDDIREYETCFAILEKILFKGYEEKVTQIKNFINEVEEILIQNNSKLVIILDEFTYYLQLLKDQKFTKSLIQLQELAETLNSNERITFVVSLHTKMDETFADKQKNLKDDINKIMGRFYEHTELSKFNLENIIESILEVNELVQRKYLKFEKPYQQIQRSTKKIGLKTSNIVNLYPFLPPTIHYLSSMSAYSSSSRTALLFVHSKLNEFLERPIITSYGLNLVGVDALWDYFSDTIKHKFAQVHIAFTDLQNHASTDEMKKLAKILATIRTTSDTETRLKVGATKEELADLAVLDLDLVESSLTELMGSKHLLKDNKKDEYQLEIGGLKPTKELIDQKMKSMTDFEVYLNQAIREKDLVPNTIDWKIEWKEVIPFYFDDHIITKIERNSSVSIIVAFQTNTQWKEIEQKFEDLVKKGKGTNTIFVIFQNDFNEELIKKNFAVSSLLVEYRNKDDKTRQSLDKDQLFISPKFNAHINEQLDLKNILLHINEGSYDTIKIKSEIRNNRMPPNLSSGISVLSRKLLELQYNQMINLKSDPELKVSNVRTWLKDIVSIIRDNYEISLNSVKGQGKTIIKQHFANLGLITEEGSEYITVKLPSETEDKTGFEMVEYLKLLAEENYHLRKNGSEVKDLEQYWKIFGNKPYGLNDNLLALYIVWTAWKSNLRVESKYFNQSFDYGNKPDIKTNHNLIDILIREAGKSFSIIKTERLNPDLKALAEQLNIATLSQTKSIETSSDLELFVIDLKSYINKTLENALNAIESNLTLQNSPLKKLLNDAFELLSRISEDIREEKSAYEFIPKKVIEVARELLLKDKSSEVSSKKTIEVFRKINLLASTLQLNINNYNRWFTDLEKIKDEKNKLSQKTFKNLQEFLSNLSLNWLFGHEKVDINVADINKEYAQYYSDSHKNMTKKRKNFMKGVKTYLSFKLLREASKIERESKFTEKEIVTLIQQEQDKCLSDYSPKTSPIHCSNCNSTLDDLENIDEYLENQDKRIDQLLLQYLNYWCDEIVTLNERLSNHINIIDLPKEETDSLREVNDLSKKIKREGIDHCDTNDVQIIISGVKTLIKYMDSISDGSIGTTAEKLTVAIDNIVNSFQEEIVSFRGSIKTRKEFLKDLILYLEKLERDTKKSEKVLY